MQRTVVLEMDPALNIDNEFNISQIITFLQDPEFPVQLDYIRDKKLKTCRDEQEQQNIKEDTGNISDASTVVDTQTEEYVYLSGLNSDNLMQFSQQSLMSELLKKENVDIDSKPNLDILPTLEEHDIGGYKFSLIVRPQQTEKLSWVYSESLNKVYIRMNDILNVVVAYTPKKPFIQLRLRVLICFVKETSEPVLRCQNHISEENEMNQQKLRSLLRCENPRTEYLGMDSGRSINDRYCILVPLCMGVKPLEDKSVRQSIAFKFACQNSCIRRRETSLIFMLENTRGEIYSQRNLNIKICSCPKRDQKLDENNAESRKRKRNDDLYPRCTKSSKQESGTLKPERSCNDLEESRIDLKFKSNGFYRITLETNSRSLVQSTINDIMRDTSCRIMKEDNPIKRERSTLFFQKLKDNYDKI